MILVVGRIWFVGFESLTTYFGLLSAGLAIAMQTPLVNLAGWGFILWRRPFNVGDRVEIAGTRGDVIDQRLFMFSLMEVGNWVNADQSTGRVIHVPNGKIFTEALANYSQGFHHIWHEVPVLITFESDWRKAKRILEEIAGHHGARLSAGAEKKVREAAKKFMIFYSTLTPAVYTTVKDCGVLLTVRSLCDPRQRRNTEQAIWEDILDAFAKESDIDFAYPTQRFYANDREGKPGTRPEAVYADAGPPPGPAGA
jgi:small-conductance mechanosensitive channel